MNEDKVWELFEQMSAILNYLHSQSPPVVHRDFSPDNLILQEDGTLKLIDFNVVHLSHRNTLSNVVGKNSYVPAEQVRGTPSPASDLYALGFKLYFLLSGSDPEPLTQSRPILLQHDISVAMDELVMQLTDQEAENRRSLEQPHRFRRPSQEACVKS